MFGKWNHNPSISHKFYRLFCKCAKLLGIFLRKSEKKFISNAKYTNFWSLLLLLRVSWCKLNFFVKQYLKKYRKSYSYVPKFPKAIDS